MIAQEIQTMGLMQRLETLDANVGRISDDRFEKLKQRGNVVSRDSLIEMHRSVNLLKGLIENDILPKIEEENDHYEMDFDAAPPASSRGK